MENRHSFQKNNRFNQQRPKQVSVDLFLFSCLEQERLNRRKDVQADLNAGRWPALKDLKVSNLPADFGAAPLKALIDRVCIWYASQFPELADDRPFDSHQLNAVVEPFLNLTLDLADIVLLKTGAILPFSDSQDPKAKEIWNDINQAIRDMFHTYEAYFNKFLTWTFGEGVEEIAEPGSVQPVGRYSPYFKAPQAQSAPAAEKPAGDKPAREMPHVKKASENRENHSSSDEITEKEAIGAVDDALKQMQDDPNVEEVFLKTDE